jgi:sugar diacid utilization regulator
MPTSTAGEIGGEGPGLVAFATLVHLAVTSDDSAGLIAAAEGDLGHPVGLAGPHGEALGHAPDDGTGEQALAVAQAAARGQLAAPPGWRVLPLSAASPPLGFLAAGTRAAGDAEARARLGLVAELVTNQLTRAALRRVQAEALVRRLISDRDLTAEQARRDASDLGLSLVSAYWPGLLSGRRSPLPGGVAATVAGAARRLVTAALAATHGHEIVLLHPADEAVRPELGPAAWFNEVAHGARSLAPGSRAQVVAGERPVGLAALRERVTELRDSLGFSQPGEDEPEVISVRHFRLERLLSGSLEETDGRTFVDEQLGTLMAWDERYGTGLLVVLEAALDFPRRDEAAGRCSMHRNTFRHRLKQAEALLGEDLDDPEARLAVHVALKLRRLHKREVRRLSSSGAH